MKLAFLIDGLRHGHGVSVATVWLAEALSCAGHEVIVCGPDLDNADALLSRAPTFARAPLDPVVGPVLHRARDVTRLIDVINRLRPDCYLPVTFPFDRLAGQLDSPTICYDHGVVSTRGAGLPLRAAVGVVAASATLARRRATGVITVSEWLAARMARFADASRIRVVPNGVDHVAKMRHGPVDRQTARRMLGVADDTFLAFTVGRLGPAARYKGIHRLAHALARRGFFRDGGLLCAAGDGSAKDYAWLAARSVTVLGRLDASGLAAAYAAADLYTSPSCWEGFNLPLLEAQWLGLPVAALDRCAHPEVILERHALLPTMAALADWIIQFAAGTPLDDQAATDRRCAFARSFTWNVAAERFTGAVGKLLGRPCDVSDAR